MSNDEGYQGVQQPNDASDEYNSQAFIVRQILNGRNFCALVKVMSVTIPGALDLAGTVDVQPLVNQIDGQGNAVAHGTINDIKYFRMQGGANAIIIDPEVGDIGMCVFCDRDSSAVKTEGDPANPGSLRRSDMADGLYLGGLLNAVPSQYVMFTEDGIEINSPAEVKLVAPAVTITTQTFTVNGATQFNGPVTGNADAVFSGKSVVHHVHSGVTRGNSNSDQPV